MTRLTIIKPTTPPKVETRKVEFSMDTSDYCNATITAEVEISGEGVAKSYVCTFHDATDQDGGELSDHLWRVIAERAEELAWEQDEAPRNWKGCQCPPRGEGTQSEIVHDRDCPLKLQGEEREAYLDLLQKEARGELDHEQANLHDSTWVYLNLK